MLRAYSLLFEEVVVSVLALMDERVGRRAKPTCTPEPTGQATTWRTRNATAEKIKKQMTG